MTDLHVSTSISKLEELDEECNSLRGECAKGELVLVSMPLSFKTHFRKCVVDCYEVFCERPKALEARGLNI